MKQALPRSAAEDIVRRGFAKAGIDPVDIVVKEYPEETIFIIRVNEWILADAAEVGNRLDEELARKGFSGFITVRKAAVAEPHRLTGRLIEGVRDERADRLARLLTERSRTSEVQPSLSYVKDAAANISNVTSSRHQLIFGRRGAGKTALMLEAKRILEQGDDLTAWLNVQTLRHEPPLRIFLWAMERVVISLRRQVGRGHDGRTSELVTGLSTRIENLLTAASPESPQVVQLVPFIQRAVRRFLETYDRRLFIFLDDFHYVAREHQPQVLDLLHGCVRDSDAWLKIAGIRHLTRWYQPSPQMGLQTGQDAALIDLDVTLQDPLRAKHFLEEVLTRYAVHADIKSLWQLFNPQALDRLVLASGAVPRDYLVLAATAIRRARTRPSARQVGGQDVNNAAGETAQVKIGELEEDLAGSGDLSNHTLTAFQNVRRFCLQETRWTYFRVDFRDKERRSDEYSLLQNAVDLRLVHLINPSVSHESQAGERFEVFMLDLSQFSGQRLKKNIQVLDFVGGHFVSKRTGERGSALKGDTAKKLIQILRRPPLFELSRLS